MQHAGRERFLLIFRKKKLHSQSEINLGLESVINQQGVTTTCPTPPHCTSLSIVFYSGAYDAYSHQIKLIKLTFIYTILSIFVGLLFIRYLLHFFPTHLTTTLSLVFLIYNTVNTVILKSFPDVYTIITFARGNLFCT